MKKTISRIVCALLCALMLTSLFACDNGGGGDDVFALTAENLSEYKIVIPDDFAAELDDVSKTLRDGIKSLTGKNVDISDDMEETEYEIILGKANRTAVTEFYKNVRNKDYGYALVGKKILIIGETEDLISRSAKLFKSYVLDEAAGKDVLLRDGESKISAGEYNYSEIKINGVNISEYTIVYPFAPSTTIEEKRVAEELAYWVLLNTGYTIPCVREIGRASCRERV